jgi:hypothetical protein
MKGKRNEELRIEIEDKRELMNKKKKNMNMRVGTSTEITAFSVLPHFERDMASTLGTHFVVPPGLAWHFEVTPVSGSPVTIAGATSGVGGEPTVKVSADSVGTATLALFVGGNPAAIASVTVNVTAENPLIISRHPVVPPSVDRVVHVTSMMHAGTELLGMSGAETIGFRIDGDMREIGWLWSVEVVPTNIPRGMGGRSFVEPDAPIHVAEFLQFYPLDIRYEGLTITYLDGASQVERDDRDFMQADLGWVVGYFDTVSLTSTFPELWFVLDPVVAQSLDFVNYYVDFVVTLMTAYTEQAGYANGLMTLRITER